MEGDEQDEKYDSFDDYRHNYGIFQDIKGKVGGDYNSFPKEIIKENIENETYIIMDSLRLKKYLMNFSNEEECQKRNCCAYINYMLNEGISNHYISPTPIFNIYNSYMNHPNNDKIKNLCLSKIIYMDKKKHEKIDKLYSAYKTCHLFFSKERNITACFLAKSCATAYNNIINEYPKPDDYKFCKTVNDFKKILEENEHISRGQCATQIPHLLSYPDSCNNILEESIKIAPMGKEARGLEAQVEPRGQSYTQKGYKMEDIPDTNTISPSSLGSALPITLFSSGISALLILLSLYKFTSFGHWLRLQTQKFKGISGKLEEEEYEMQQQNSEYEDRIAEYDGYNVSYNSL
ncbi:PIR Superfamily Protein [Plasmodium ovale wallikeri]|uniref:Plasmodium vivax Vir protein, putative n=2 Tax=Plasmodium ovale TaxID=36330 RepID=A0A1C3KK92_PLAOA|nr:PIR Superfamily Protein [Plasmodium ovale wallikeri]SBT74355.1 Plasmodium vivax Vir protein, putative [Plasmodium ovale]